MGLGNVRRFIVVSVVSVGMPFGAYGTTSMLRSTQTW